MTVDGTPNLWENAHAHLLITCYRVAFDLLRGGVFTAHAAWAEVKRSHASGYHFEEVVDALGFLTRRGDLRLVQPCDPNYLIYEAGQKFPVAWAHKEDDS